VKQSRTLIKELQTTNSELVTRLKTNGRERSNIDAQQRRELDTKQREIEILMEEKMSLSRVENHLKSQLREMATTNGELLARLNAHAATSATSRLEARTIRQEADSLKDKMMNALKMNEKNLDQSMIMESKLAENDGENKRLVSKINELEKINNDFLQKNQQLESAIAQLEDIKVKQMNEIVLLKESINTIKVNMAEKHAKSLEMLTLNVQENRKQAIVERKKIENEKDKLMKENEKLNQLLVDQKNNIQKNNTQQTVLSPSDVDVVNGGVNNKTDDEKEHLIDQVNNLKNDIIKKTEICNDINERNSKLKSKIINIEKDLSNAILLQKDETTRYERECKESERLREKIKVLGKNITIDYDFMTKGINLIIFFLNFFLIEDADLHRLKIEHADNISNTSSSIEEIKIENAGLKYSLDTAINNRTEIQEKNVELNNIINDMNKIKIKQLDDIKNLKIMLSNIRQSNEEERINHISKLQQIDEETKRRDLAHRQLGKALFMFIFLNLFLIPPTTPPAAKNLNGFF
jgi:hypothetical protein